MVKADRRPRRLVILVDELGEPRPARRELEVRTYPLDAVDKRRLSRRGGAASRRLDDIVGVHVANKLLDIVRCEDLDGRQTKLTVEIRLFLYPS